MAMVNADDSCHFFLADSQSKSVGLVWGLAATSSLSLHSSNEPGELSQWLCHDDSTINIVSVIITLKNLTLHPKWWYRTLAPNTWESSITEICSVITRGCHFSLTLPYTFTVSLGRKFVPIVWSHRTWNVSLHYLVKYLAPFRLIGQLPCIMPPCRN